MIGSLRTARGLPHAARLGLLMLLGAVVLGFTVARSEILFADGLRYIRQAQQIDRGDWSDGLRRAVDHPLYPLAIATTRRVLGLANTPEGWQLAAQVAAATAGVLLACPLYLIARRLFGGSAAWLGVIPVWLTPIPPQVFADALSEGWFLLLWSWGLWAALRFLDRGALGWLAASLGLGVLAYLVRPEGLLLPAALVAALLVSPLWRATRLPARRWWTALACLGLGGALLVGPFLVWKGGIATKPAVGRLLGLAPPSRPDAVERERPLPPGQTRTQAAVLAARAAWTAVRNAVTVPLLPLAVLGFWTRISARGRVDARSWLLIGAIGCGWWLALMRLHATGGYCTPRHALILALIAFAASASGFRVILAWLLRLRRWPWRRAIPALASLALVLATAGLHARSLTTPLNAGRMGYREAGRWLAANSEAGDHVADVTGWALFYGERSGYTFADLHAAHGDPAVRYVVVRDAHLTGPWGYCERLRELVRGSAIVARFPPERRSGVSRVSIFDRRTPATAARPGFYDPSRR